MMQKLLALAEARGTEFAQIFHERGINVWLISYLLGLRPEQVMVLMDDPDILAQILEPPKATAPQFASSHFVAQQNQTETVQKFFCFFLCGKKRIYQQQKKNSNPNHPFSPRREQSVKRNGQTRRGRRDRRRSATCVPQAFSGNED